jgi:hypothetical protein
LPALVALAVLGGCGDAPPEPNPEPRVAVAEDTTGLRLPGPESGEYCRIAQRILASTTLGGENTVFTDMPSYRHSKPSADPHRIYQVVTYAGRLPLAVSCKVKSAAHLRAVYGPRAAGTQRSCAELTRRARDLAVAELMAGGSPDLARDAAAYIVDEDEPFVTGRSYLADFELSYRDRDGALHLRSPGLFQDYDSWITRFLPAQFQGQHYCHVATPAYMEALARGELEPGTVITTADEAPVVPPPGP